MTSRPSDAASSNLPSPSVPIHHDSNPLAVDPHLSTSIPRPPPFRVHARTSSLDARLRTSPTGLRQTATVAAASEPVPSAAPARPKSTELLAPSSAESKNVPSVMALLEEERAKASTSLNLSDRNLVSLPPEVGSLTALERLGLSNNMLTALPAEIAGLVHLRYLNLRSNQIREFPTVICQLACLEILDISRNKLKKLPASFGNLMNLKVLSLARNKLHHLPLYVGSMAQLKVLKLEHNPLQWPPPDILQNPADVPHETWVQAFKDFLLAEGTEAPVSPTRTEQQHQRFATLEMSASSASPPFNAAFQTPQTPKPHDDVPPEPAVPPAPVAAVAVPSRDCHAQIRNYLRRRQYELDAGVEPPPAADAAPSRVLEALAYSLSCLHKAASHLLLEIADTDGTDPRLVDVAAHIDGLNSATSALVILLIQVYQPRTPHPADVGGADYFGANERQQQRAIAQLNHHSQGLHGGGGAATITTTTTTTTTPGGPSPVAAANAASAALAAASQLVRVLRGPADAHVAHVDVRTARTLLSDWHLANVELADAAAEFDRMLDGSEPPPPPPLSIADESIAHQQHHNDHHKHEHDHPHARQISSSSSSLLSQSSLLAANLPAGTGPLPPPPAALCEAARNAVVASRQVLALLLAGGGGGGGAAEEMALMMAPAVEAAKDLVAALRLMQDSGNRLSDLLDQLVGDVRATPSTSTTTRRVAEESSQLIKAVTKMSAEARTLAKTHPFPRPLMAALHSATKGAKMLAVCIAGINNNKHLPPGGGSGNIRKTMADINWIDRILSTVASKIDAASQSQAAGGGVGTTTTDSMLAPFPAQHVPTTFDTSSADGLSPADLTSIDNVNFMSFGDAALPLDLGRQAHAGNGNSDGTTDGGAAAFSLPSDFVTTTTTADLGALAVASPPISLGASDESSLLFALDARPSLDNINADYHDADLYNEMFPIQSAAVDTAEQGKGDEDASTKDVEDISDEDNDEGDIPPEVEAEATTDSLVAISPDRPADPPSSIALEVSMDDVVVPETMVIIPIESAVVSKSILHKAKDEAATADSDEDDAGKNSDFAFSDSSSSDSDDDDEDETPKLTTAQREKLLQSLDANPEDPSDAPASLRTKNEVATLPPVNPVTEPIPHDAPILAAGKIQSVVGELLIIQTPANVDPDRALDADTVLVNADRKPIGKIFETFGPVTRPFYSVRFNSAEEIAALDLPTGTDVYVPRAPGLEKVVFTRALKALKGSDASNINDEECDEDELEFSDDEAEAEHKRQLKLARKRKRGGAEAEEGEEAAAHGSLALPLPPVPDEIADSAEYQLNGRPAYGAAGRGAAARGGARGSRGGGARGGGFDRGGGRGGGGRGGGSLDASKREGYGPSSDGQYGRGDSFAASARGGRGRGGGGGRGGHRSASGAGGAGAWSGNPPGSFHSQQQQQQQQQSHRNYRPQQQFGQQQQQQQSYAPQQPFYGAPSFPVPYQQQQQQQPGFAPQPQTAFPAAQLAMAALLIQQQQQQQRQQQQSHQPEGSGSSAAVAPVVAAPPAFDLASMMGLMQGVMQNQAAAAAFQQQQQQQQQPQYHHHNHQQPQQQQHYHHHHHPHSNQQFAQPQNPVLQGSSSSSSLGLPPRPPQGHPPPLLRQQQQQQQPPPQ
ncbi:H/ACA ribonucleoprotein complex non-core subunit naf1 [Geranomyces michiganensis]|nr:H/ACA ribonucleoprotein complex non-core subunit naf1 [Geranomyces michiganensis]